MKFAFKLAVLAAVCAAPSFAFQATVSELPCRLAVAGAPQSDSVDVASGLLRRNGVLQVGKLTPGAPFPSGTASSCSQLSTLYGRTAGVAPRVYRPSNAWIVADFNNDGLADSITLSGRGFTRQMVRSTGVEAPVTVTLGPVGHNYTSGVAADVNGDGRKDLIICCSGSGANSRLVVALGNGDGTFQAPQDSIPGLGRFDVQDWNGDGRPDIIAIASGGQLNVAYGQPNGTFSVAQTTSIGTDTIVFAADTNGDGFMDAVVVGSFALKVYFGTASGAFFLQESSVIPIYPSADAMAGDFNGDGKLDVLISNGLGAAVLMVGAGVGKFNPTPFAAIGSFTRPDAAVDSSGRMSLVLPDAGAPALQVVPVSASGALVAPPLYAVSQDGFAPPVTYDPARSTAVVADFDHDGKDDTVVFLPRQNDGALLVYRGGALGSLTPQTPIVIPPLNSAQVSVPRMEIGDFNGDGRPDLMVMETDGQRLLVYLTLLDGSFAPPVTTLLPSLPHDIVLADFNDDGRLDVAVATGSTFSNNGRISVYNGLGTGAFALPQVITTSAVPHRLAVGDFNNDFKKDIVYIPVSTDGAAAAGIILNRTNNTFLASQPIPLPAHAGIGNDSTLDAIQAGDVNRDGLTDVIIASSFTSGPLAVLLGKGNGTFTAQPNIAISPNVASMQLRDIDGDGNLDILTAHCCGTLTSAVYFGRPDGTFNTGYVLPTGPRTSRVLLGDVNGDGQQDLVAHTLNGISVQPFGAPSGLLVDSSASFLGAVVALDSIATLRGQNLANVTQSADVPADQIGGTRVTITDSSGQTVGVKLYYVSQTVINFWVPPGLALGPATITVTPPQGKISFGSVILQRVAPGIYLADASRLVAANVIRVNAAGLLTVESPYKLQAFSLVPVPVNLGPVGDTVVLVLYGTGVRGRTSLSQVGATIGGVAANVAYAGAQGSYLGFDQINVTIPRSLIGKGDVDVILTVEGQSSNIGRIVIQ